ncbi:cytochrome C oxidase subunit IV family protein [Chloroflexota bacterium]
MDTERLTLILWIVTGFLMATGVLGVALALILDRKSAPPSAEAVPQSVIPAVAAREEVPPKPVDEKVLASRKAAYRQGLLVLLGLAVLTALEFWIATAAGGSPVFLFVLILAKAGLILQYYMHLGHLWGEEEAH